MTNLKDVFRMYKTKFWWVNDLWLIQKRYMKVKEILKKIDKMKYTINID